MLHIRIKNRECWTHLLLYFLISLKSRHKQPISRRLPRQSNWTEQPLFTHLFQFCSKILCIFNEYFSKWMSNSGFLTTSGIYFNIFFKHPLLVKNNLKLFFQFVGSYLKLMNVNQAWLSKSIGKYYSWLWYHSKNIEFITRGLRPLVINSIFFLVITITTRDIFQYFFTAMHDSYNPTFKTYYIVHF